jgi:hypothetical protein
MMKRMMKMQTRQRKLKMKKKFQEVFYDYRLLPLHLMLWRMLMHCGRE